MVRNKMMRHPEGYLRPVEVLPAIAMARSNDDERAALYMQVLSETGRRACEILGQRKYNIKKTIKYPHPLMRGICPEDVDEVEGKLTCRIAKKREKRLVYESFPIRRELARALVAYAKSRYIAPDKEIFKFTTRTGQNLVKKYCQYVTSRTFKLNQKAFRHGWAIAAAENSTTPADVLAIKVQLSHNSLDTTYEYMQSAYSETKLRKLLHAVLRKKYTEEL